MKLHIIDMLYSDNGHFLDDACLYSILNDKYDITYHTNGYISRKEKLTKIGIEYVEYKKTKNMIEQYRLLSRILKSTKNEKVFITSVSYISLFIYLLSHKKPHFYLLIHFLPVNRPFIYRSIFKFFVKKEIKIAVLSEMVKKQITKQMNIDYNTISVIMSRHLQKRVSIVKPTGRKVITFIGAFNNSKNVEIVVRLLETNKYPNLIFKFISKGISNELISIRNNSNVYIEDKYVEDDEYQGIIKDSNYILIPYKEDYGVRFSGLVFDAFNNGTKIIASALPQFEFYTKRYNAGYTYRSPSDLDKILKEIEVEKDNQPLDSILYSHFSEDERKKKLEYFLSL